ncbi:MAG: hypothetical protein M0P58_09270 [Bacteroidales bacterium]|nr:hypothetical protein [Bacteroidales bacterium]
MNFSQKIVDVESTWGGFYEPDHPQNQPGRELKVALFGSATGGQLILESLIRFNQKNPGLLRLVGMVTDDPVDQKAKISLKKRIWGNYTREESADLMNKIIDTSMQAGIPCYTGKVKTNYFRKIFSSWDPDVLIMNCFGQKLDAYLYDYPPFGAYNFHPSNLASHIGVGAQPFQEIMRLGLHTSPIVIHKVTEVIDDGPIVGISPEINIRLHDGSYPLNIITLLHKLNSITGWMTIDILLEILEQRSLGKKGALTYIDFEKKIPKAIKHRLLIPATNELSEKYELPLHPKLI